MPDVPTHQSRCEDSGKFDTRVKAILAKATAEADILSKLITEGHQMGEEAYAAWLKSMWDDISSQGPLAARPVPAEEPA